MFSRFANKFSESGILEAQNVNLHTSLGIVIHVKATLRIELDAQIVISTMLKQD